MPKPAFDTQYSPLLTDATVAEIEVMALAAPLVTVAIVLIPAPDAATVMADLIIERQIQKAESRKKFGGNENDWNFDV